MAPAWWVPERQAPWPPRHLGIPLPGVTGAAGNPGYDAAYQVADAMATGSRAVPGPVVSPPVKTCSAGAQGCDVNDRAVFRAAAAISVLLCLSWDFATVALFVVLPLQLAAIGLLYWGADGLFGPGSAGSGPRPGRAAR